MPTKDNMLSIAVVSADAVCPGPNPHADIKGERVGSNIPFDASLIILDSEYTFSKWWSARIESPELSFDTREFSSKTFRLLPTSLSTARMESFNSGAPLYVM